MMGRAGIVWALLLGSVGSAAGQAMDSEEGARQEIEAAVDARLAPISYDGAILYAYRPHAGQRAQFDAGYRDHLEWHRAKADSLPWYGWDVIVGRRTGEFIDGTFGIRFRALDERVDPAGDAAHAAASFAPHAAATARWMVRLRRELSTSSSLEDRTPSAMLHVVTYRMPPAVRAAFEAVLGSVRARDGLAPYAVYESVVGTSDVEYMLLVEGAGFGAFDDVARDPSVAIADALAQREVLDVRVETELWALRRDLTLLPERAAR